MAAAPIGQIETVLFDNRPESPTYKQKLVFYMGDSQEYGADTLEVCVKIPPGVLHGLKVLSPSAHLFYITSETYNRQEEGRFRFDSAFVGHAWGENPIVADNDKVDFCTRCRTRSAKKLAFAKFRQTKAALGWQLLSTQLSQRLP